MTFTRTLTFTLLLLAGTIVCLAQTEQAGTATAPPDQTITVTISAKGARFAALGGVKQMRLEVFNANGDPIYNSDFQAGNVRDWALEDKLGGHLPDGSYLCVVTVRELSGRLSMKQGTVLMQGGQTSLRLGEGDRAGAIEPEKSLAAVPGDASTALTLVAHDGRSGQVVSTKGPLTFRTGDFFGGADREQMRLTEDGRLGIGTTQPQASLDVAGAIRARGGLIFSDGTALTSAGKSGTVNGAGEILPNVAGIGTQNFFPKWTETGGNGTLSNSGMFEAANGFIGIGTTIPTHPFVVRRNGGSLGVHNVGELFVDRDDRTRSASLTVGTAGTLKWIFGMPAGNDGFQVYDLTNNISRFYVDPANGNIGMGNTSPQSRLDVTGDFKVSGNAVINGNIAAKYQDIAEWVPARQPLSAGTVVVLDMERANAVVASSRVYDTHVAGVVSAQPGVLLGEGGAGKALVATSGRVKVRVDASRHPIKIGDLLVTSGKTGVAMKSQPVKAGGARLHRPGTIIGKALEPLASGEGEILVLLSLQ